jgi:hypothetical protein
MSLNTEESKNIPFESNNKIGTDIKTDDIEQELQYSNDIVSNVMSEVTNKNAKTWFYKHDGNIVGPFDFDQIISLAWQNIITEDIQVSDDNQKSWHKPSEKISPAINELYKNSPKVWFTNKNGDREGPFNELEMKAVIEKGAISYGDAVYKEGRQNWVAVEDTELKKFIHTPPPVVGENAPNGSIWWVAFSPLISSIALLLMMSFSWKQYIQTNVQAYADIYHFLSNWGVVVYIFCNLIFIGIDSSKLKNLGHNTEQFGSIFWIPVYIWKRNKILQKTQASFWIWMILTFFDVLIGPALM